MIIRVADIKPNPFRFSDDTEFANSQRYPIDPVKVQALKDSIFETSFWDNLLLRRHPTEQGKFQAAYGHHRLAALRELEYEEINVPVRELDDMTMLKIMANENMSEWRTKPVVMVHTVEVANEFLMAEVEKVNWEWPRLTELCQSLFDDKRGFDAAKGHAKNRFGSRIIAKLLCKPWTYDHIQFANNILELEENNTVSREAVEKFDGIEVARKFIFAAKGIKELTPVEQIIIADDVKDKYDKAKKSNSPGLSRDSINDYYLDSVEKKIIPKAKGNRRSELQKQVDDAREKFMNPEWKKCYNSLSESGNRCQEILTGIENLQLNEGDYNVFVLGLENTIEEAGKLLNALKNPPLLKQIEEPAHVS